MTAKCPYFRNCGGCQAQHIPYETQLENKKKLLCDAIINSKIEFNGEVSIQSDQPYNYRNRMDFVFCQKGPSFRRQGSWHKLVHIENCPIANEKVNQLLAEVQEWFNNSDVDVFDMVRKKGTLRYAVIRSPDFTEDSSISFVLNSDSTTIGKNVDAIKEFAKTTTAKNVIVTYAHSKTDISTSSDYFVVKGEDMITEKISGSVYSFSVQGFMQNNSVMSQKMVEYTKQLLAEYETKDSFLLDLYGGVGLFGIGLAKEFSEVLVVESFEGSIESAKKNAELNNHDNVQAECIDARQLRKLDIPKKAGGKNIFVLTDPPRSGMDIRTIQYLMGLAPKTLIYVSCNPKQLSRELSTFKERYKIKSACAFDLFPQTNHVESVVELERL